MAIISNEVMFLCGHKFQFSLGIQLGVELPFMW